MKINDVLKYTLWAGLFAGLFIPFVVTNGLFFPFITGKGFVFRIGVEILFVLWCWLMLREKNYIPRFSWIFGALLIFTGVIGIANAFGANPYKSFWSNYERMEGYVTVAHLLLYFIIASSVLNTKKLWNMFWGTSVGASVIMCLYGFAQLMGWIVINQGGVRLDGTLGNAIYLAAYMMFNMFLAAYLYTQNRQWSTTTKFALFGPIVLMQSVILYYTATRGVILGLIGGVVLTAVLIALFEREQKKLRRGAIIVCVAVVLVIGGFVAIRNTSFVQHSPTLSRFASLSWEDIKTQGRYYIWPMAIEGVKERPLLGWGQEGFSYVFNKNYNPAMYGQEAWFDRTHNMYLDWLVAGGILGFIAYLSLFVVFFYYVWRKTNFSVREKSILTGLVGAYMFQGLFVFDNLVTYLYFFSLLAFVHADATRDRRPVRWIERVSEKKDIVSYVVMPIAVVVCIVALYTLNIKPIRANQTLISALSTPPAQSLPAFKKAVSYNAFGTQEATEQMYINLSRFQAAGVDPAVREEFEQETKKQLIAQAEKVPADTRRLLFVAGFLNRIGQFEEAIPYAERALETSPRKQAIIFEIAVSHVNLKRYAEAQKWFKRAYELAPDFVEAKIFYGLGALYVGDQKLSDEVLKTVDPKVLVNDDRILSAYVELKKWPQMIDILKRRLDSDPENVQRYFSLAAGYLQAGDRFSAIQTLRRSVEVDPNAKTQVDQIVSEIQAGRI